MHVAKECFNPFQVAFLLQKDSPYKQRIDEVLLRMQEAGLLNRFYNEELDKIAKKDPHSLENDIHFKTIQPLTMGHMKGLFVLSSFLWMIAVGAFVYEVISGWRQKKKRNAMDDQ